LKEWDLSNAKCVALFSFQKNCHKKCGTFFILKKLPQKLWQKFHFEKSATKSPVKTSFQKIPWVTGLIMKKLIGRHRYKLGKLSCTLSGNTIKKPATFAAGFL